MIPIARQPVIVAWQGNRSAVCAASDEARDFGVRSAMPVLQAERLCPGAIFVPPDFAFAGSERRIAEEIALRMKSEGFAVFYDSFYPETLWGKNLVEFFDAIYRKQARYCVVLISPEYRDRMWTQHERRSAQARALEERGREYILPIVVAAAELPACNRQRDI